jgi:hypothetical protein
VSVGCQHDFVDWLAALGPTLATVFAGIATIIVYLRGEKFQRQLVRPLLVIRQKFNPMDDERFVRWIAEIRNEGQGAANIDAFTVVASEDIMEPEAMLEPKQYWERVLYALNILRVQRVEHGNTILPPLSVATNEVIVLFDAYVQGTHEGINAAVKRLELRVRYRSSLGETFTIRHRYGHAEA